eukprot:CAMPEP_0172677208 /NCGR_PEP_ID=MMETSP1074-20121228/14520_1 /TAXON_ID=2916 /ORGANISM="Ceratium fusus, Strain PA161109" /LENGTH=124 /DNA_ID=CAMNT_0013495009 /DNA_START=118 /DNA_END=489 /DNA_ORIENTATION=+
MHSNPQYRDVLFNSTGNIASFGRGSGSAWTATIRRFAGSPCTLGKMALEPLARSNGAEPPLVNAASVDETKLQWSTTTATTAKTAKVKTGRRMAMGWARENGVWNGFAVTCRMATQSLSCPNLS